MFDIGFFELIVIGILALLVLGPERLPKAARTAGMWIGRIKQGFSSIQQEVNQQLHMEEMQRQLEENRRKLEETLRKQEQSITESAGPQPTTPDTAESKPVQAVEQDAPVAQVRPEDEGPFGTTPSAPASSATTSDKSPSSDHKG
ncbi:Sec-independent protein translocase protein TatB [Oceanospirillum sanctuarii]|uniref:Sec-independent protein translocase protein TatB n=1 Tax=Oceanospirillum sanctuarii TaxID=1434821 RepID=UPI000A3B41C5|nr:Sec-independent protein translocase protein TatB [Oceanospirillum sanctuarii]